MSIAHTSLEGRLQFDKSDRLTKALRIGGITSNEMAEHLDVSRTTISNYINGRTEPKRSVMRDWAMRTGVPVEWLESGHFPNEPDPSDYKAPVSQLSERRRIHTKTVHMTPNDSYHGNLKRFIERLECWNQGR